MSAAELKTPDRCAFTDDEIAAAEIEADKCGDRFTTEQVLGKQTAGGPSASGYQVVWLPSARSQLPQASSGNDLEPAASVCRLLQDSPTTHGKELLGRARLAAVDGWQVLYRVDEPDKLVTVLGVKLSG